MRLASRMLVVAIGMCALVATVGPAWVFAGDPLWTDSQGASAPPELARINDLLYSLAERLKPPLVQVQVQVRRTPESQAEGSSQQGPPKDERRRGSGFIIRQDGFLVTNAHVVDGAERIQIKLADGRRFDGRLVGYDHRVDLALVKIEASGLPVAVLGDSNSLRVGEFVLALGQPFGLEQTVSFGIVGRKGAPLRGAGPGFDYIQTEAAVHPGNSGGPLVNMAGEVVGVNSKATGNGSIGFAIPVNLVKAILPQLAEKGRVQWGWLGVRTAEITDDDAPKYGLTEARGVLIRNVVTGQPADQAGMKADDVVLSVDGTVLDGQRDLLRIISSTPVGRTVTLKVMRDGRPTELHVIIGPYRGTSSPPSEGAPPSPR